MLEHSAGILIYKYEEERLKVMLAHPGGPFWQKKDIAAWSIPKGLVEKDEENIVAAKREFYEETGISLDVDLLELGSIKQGSKKVITIYATQMDVDVKNVKSNMFEMEWPPKSGRIEKFPENDKAEWFSIEIAREKIFKGQVGFLDRLEKILGYTEVKVEYNQLSLFE